MKITKRKGRLDLSKALFRIMMVFGPIKVRIISSNDKVTFYRLGDYGKA